MIRYTLTCDQDHQFESWFQSSAAFDTLADGGHLACPVCGSAQVQRALMAPAVAAKSNKKDGAAPSPAQAAPAKTGAPLAGPMSEAEAALAHLRKEVEENSEYVGLKFADEARKMHDGESPERAIYGEAKLDDAKKLIEDGVPVAPLPFLPKRKTN